MTSRSRTPSQLRADRRARSSTRSAVEGLERRVLFAAGDPDPTFGGDGVATFDLNVHDWANGVAVQADGKVLAVGRTTRADEESDFLVVRFNADGTPDAGFGAGGAVRTDIAGLGDFASAVELLPDGRFIVVGLARTGSAPAQFRWAVARYRPDGSLDPTFSTDGIDTVPAASTQGGGAAAVRLQPDGKAVIVGDLGRNFGVVRYNANGTLDRSFDGDGIVQTNFPGDVARATALDFMPDGRIVVVGTLTGSINRGGVARYLPDGRPDPSFSSDGRSYVRPWFAGENPLLWGVEVQGDGKMVVLEDDFTLRRLKVGGGEDLSFGNGGIARAAPADADEFRFARSLAQQPDGKFVAGGGVFAILSERHSAYLTRFTPNGQVDTSFGTNGEVRKADPNATTSTMAGIDLAPDGRIVGVGQSSSPTDQSNFVSDVVAYRFLGDNQTPPPGDAVTVQAENANSMQGAVVARDHAGYTGTGYVDFVANDGANVTWRVNGVTRPGTYLIDFRYANGSSSARRIQIEANVPNNPSQIVSFPPTGSWSTWRTVSVPVTVDATSFEVKAWTIGNNGPNIDSLTVRPAAQPPRTFQAEQATLVGARIARDHAGYTGTGFVDFIHDTGDAIEWTIDNPVAGLYALDFRYANGSTIDRAASLWVNGEEMSDSLGFLPTASWSTWRESSWTVRLETGTNRIRLETFGRPGPNIDAMTVRETT